MKTHMTELNLNAMAAVTGGKDLPGGPIGMPTPMKEDPKKNLVQPGEIVVTPPSLFEGIVNSIKFLFS